MSSSTLSNGKRMLLRFQREQPELNRRLDERDMAELNFLDPVGTRDTRRVSLLIFFVLSSFR
ncbi:hypothetical protein LINGRAHAP2_LOCUS25237 [Linum grandiflorum]